MTWVFAILFTALLLSVLPAIFLYWLLWAPGEDDGSQQDPTDNVLIARMRSWLRQSTPRLDYRRDKKGRFRKVRRG